MLAGSHLQKFKTVEGHIKMKKKTKNSTFASIADFIYESGILAKTPRSGLWFLGTGEQSVAEHTLRTAFIGYALSYLDPKADRNRVVLICLFHDFGEGRTSDLNYVHQRYGRLAEAHAIEDIAKSIPFGQEIQNFYKEMEAKETREAKLARDADQLEWLATMREQEHIGNTKAKTWTYNRVRRCLVPAAFSRLSATSAAIAIVNERATILALSGLRKNASVHSVHIKTTLNHALFNVYEPDIYAKAFRDYFFLFTKRSLK